MHGAQCGQYMTEATPRTSVFNQVVRTHLGERRLELSVERDAGGRNRCAQSNKAEDEFRAADESEGLSDHHDTSSCVC
jgi:hypothetical protein